MIGGVEVNEVFISSDMSLGVNVPVWFYILPVSIKYICVCVFIFQDLSA